MSFSVLEGSSNKVTKKKKPIGPVEADPNDEIAISEEYGPHLPPTPSNPIDEIPIVKSGPSSFEELLERELAKEQAMKSGSCSTSAAVGTSVPKSNFLKRGKLRV